MSAFISAVGETSAVLVTDGAAYDNAGVIVSIGSKVTLGKVAPIAITTRGNHALGRKLQQTLCDLADRFGVEYALRVFEDELPGLAADPKFNGLDYVHFHIVAFSLMRGPCQFSAHNLPFAFSDGQEPLKLTMPEGVYNAGTRVSLPALAAAGVRQRRDDETLDQFLEVEGVSIMEAMRRCPATPLPGEVYADEQYLIGGQCDVTVVNVWGAKTKTVRVWPDEVGKRIDPFAAVAQAA